MAITSDRSAVNSTREHVVLFYERDSDLVQAVGSYLASGLREGGSSLVVATGEHRRAFEAYVEAGGVDLAEATRNGRFLSLDAGTVLAQLTVDGRVDPDAFRRVIAPLVRAGARAGGAVRVYGEMVALLWDAGDVPGAIELETLWNELAEVLPFTLFCAYPATSASDSGHVAAFDHVCHLHSAVLEPPTCPPRRSGARVEVSARFAPDRASPGAARRLTVEALRSGGYEPGLVEDAALVVTELANNAVVHAHSSFSVVVRATEAGVRVSVEDGTGIAPMLGDARPLAESGRGLDLVSALSDRWGVEATPRGKVFWADLCARAAPERSPV